MLSMCCDLYNALLESWRGQWRWHQSRHGHDDVTVADIYDTGRVCGDRGTLYAQFGELRRSEQPTDSDVLLWSDVSVNIGRGVIDRFDKARAGFYDRNPGRASPVLQGGVSGIRATMMSGGRAGRVRT